MCLSDNVLCIEKKVDQIRCMKLRICRFQKEVEVAQIKTRL